MSDGPAHLAPLPDRVVRDPVLLAFAEEVGVEVCQVTAA